MQLHIFDLRLNIYFLLMFIVALYGANQPKYWEQYIGLIYALFIFGIGKILVQHYHYGAYEKDDSY